MWVRNCKISCLFHSAAKLFMIFYMPYDEMKNLQGPLCAQFWYKKSRSTLICSNLENQIAKFPVIYLFNTPLKFLINFLQALQ